MARPLRRRDLATVRSDDVHDLQEYLHIWSVSIQVQLDGVVSRALSTEGFPSLAPDGVFPVLAQHSAH